MEGLIYDIKKYVVTDGPGFRTSVYLKGCPLDCIWCNQPEGKKETYEILFDKSKCKLCYKCSQACNGRILAEEENRTFECNMCGLCADDCPSGARVLCGRVVESEDLIKEILPEAGVYKGSGGGLTLTGGEPFMQPGFVFDILKEAKRYDINTAVDTCGHMDFEFIEPCIPYVDYFLYDIKFFDEQLHIDYTSVSNTLIIENLKKLTSYSDVKVIVRFMIIDDINSNLEEMKNIARLLYGLNIFKIEIFPYTDKDFSKYGCLGTPIYQNILKAPQNKTLTYAKRIFSKVCENVEIIRY